MVISGKKIGNKVKQASCKKIIFSPPSRLINSVTAVVTQQGAVDTFDT